MHTIINLQPEVCEDDCFVNHTTKNIHLYDVGEYITQKINENYRPLKMIEYLVAHIY